MSKSPRVRTAALAAFAAAPLALTASMAGFGAAGVTTVGVVAQSAASVAASTGSVQPLVHSASHHISITPLTTAECEANYGVACYSPNQFRTALNLNPLYAKGLTGKGRTIAIVDPFGSPTAKADLLAFDKAFGLADPPSFKIIQPVGAVPPFDKNNSDVTGWAFETDLDVQMAHAMAPGANILLVETPVTETEGVQGFPEIVAAENYVIKNHMADVISQSFGATEGTFPNAQSILNLRSAFKAAQMAGVTVLAASGDAGPTDYNNATFTTYYTHRVQGWPSADPLVTSVGGMKYFLDATGNQVRPPSVWNENVLFNDAVAGGGGDSAVFARPAYQNSVANRVGAHRGTPDISASASVDGGAIVYLGKDIDYLNSPAGFDFVGGTSEAAPQFAGVVAIADQLAGHRLGLINPAIYKLNAEHAAGLQDVTDGTTTVTFTQGGKQHTVLGYDARLGYDMATGVGGVNAAKFVSELVAASN